MVSVAIVAGGMYMSAGAATAAGAVTAASVGWMAAASVASMAAQQYIDQPYIIPALFGSDAPKDQNKIGNINLPTTNPGEPRYRVYGREAYVPGHFLWITDQKVLTQSSGGGSGKGATAPVSVTERFADIGLSVCDGPITSITAAMSNRAVFYGQRASSASVFTDSRVRFQQSDQSVSYGKPIYRFNQTGNNAPVAGDPKSWHPGVTTVGGSSVASNYIESVWGETPKRTTLLVKVRPNYGVSESLGNHFDAGDIVELYNVGEGDQRWETPTGPSGNSIREGVYAVTYVGLDAGFETDTLSLLPLSGQRADNVSSNGFIRDWTELDPIVIRRVDESVCGFTSDFNVVVPEYDSQSNTFAWRRRFGLTDPLNHELMANQTSTTSTGEVEVRLVIEVFGMGGGFYITSGGNIAEIAVPCRTKMGRTRLKEGNLYQLQGFCNFGGQHSQKALNARLESIRDANTNFPATMQQPLNNQEGYVPGDRYFLEMQVVESDLKAIMTELDIGSGLTYAGSCPGNTGLFPGNGQATPHLATTVTIGMNFASNPPQAGNVLSGTYGSVSGSSRILSSTSNSVTIIAHPSGKPSGSMNHAGGTIFVNSVSDPVTADGSFAGYGTGTSPTNAPAKGATADFSTFDPAAPASGTISTDIYDCRTFPGNAENLNGSPASASTAKGPDRAGGAQPTQKGGLGDVGFCILPPRLDTFTAPTGDVGENIGAQTAEINLGGPSQAALTSSDGIAHRGLAHVRFGDLNLYQFGNAIPQVSFKVQESASRSVGDICSMLIEEAAPAGTVVPGLSSNTVAYGYSVAGGTPIKQAIQPLSVAYGFSMQDRAGRFTMLQDSELPVVPVPATKLNGRAYSGAEGLMRGLPLTKIDSDDMPQRVTIKYSAIATGNEEARSAGIRSPGSRNSGTRDAMEIDVRPLVLSDGYAKTRAQQLLDKTRNESETSRTVLPPSRMDVMPGHVITTTTNNRIMTAPSVVDTVAGTFFAGSSFVGDVIPGTVSVRGQLRKVSGSYDTDDYSEEVINVTMVDDGSGGWLGLPDEVTLNALSVIDYDLSVPANQVTLYRVFALLSTASVSAGWSFYSPSDFSISYSHYKQKDYRATRAVLSGYDFSVDAPLVSVKREHTVPVFQHRITQALKPVTSSSSRSSFLFPVEDPSIDGPWPSVTPTFGLGLESPNASGATIFESTDGIVNWEEVGRIFGNAKVGKIEKVLDGPEETSVNTMTRWNVSKSLDSYVDHEQVLIVSGMSLPEGLIGDHESKYVINGLNNFLIGDEVIGALSVSDGPSSDELTLRGLMRGLRGTVHAAKLHAVGTQVTYLPVDDGMGIAHFDDPKVASGPGSTRYFKAVLPGETLAQTPVTEIQSRAMRSLPSSPVVNEDSLKINNTPNDPNEHAITLKWGVPATGRVAIFQEPKLPPYPEIYEVYAFNPLDVVGSNMTELEIDQAIIRVSKRVWNIQMGNGYREIVYPGTEQLEDGFATGDKITFQIYAISPVGRGPRSFPDFEEAQVLMTYSAPDGG